MAKSQSWMWENGKNGAQGAYYDADENHILWFDQPGCACASGGESQQSAEDFLNKGPRFIVPPDDVLQEMRDAIQHG